MMFILFIVTMLVSSVKVKAESSEITNLLEQFYDLNNGELPFAMTEEELRCVDGVLYGRDILLLYPKTLTHSCFEIPNDIGYIWDFAFTDNESLKKGCYPGFMQDPGGVCILGVHKSRGSEIWCE